MANHSNKPAAIILAAGKGTRMKSDLPKVCHIIGDRPMICAVVDACLAAGCDKIVVVVGYKQELVREALESYGDRVEYAIQDEQLGTGHAVKSAAQNFANDDRDVLVLCGDGPLIREQTLTLMLERHTTTHAAATLATSLIENPDGYGRIVRDADGGFVQIVEQKNATPDQLKINEVNPSYYCFGSVGLFACLATLPRNELTGEYYVTDVPAMLLAQGGGGRGGSGGVEVIDAVPPEDILSINTLDQLADVDRVFRARREGVV
ncbi:MAG: bifunctional UDP-N-acetylglucosamine pyrophosphorylase/glucosamine-1-phosphate N-acetyltransferase [Phycisphaerales bacterium]|jgi:bifunctional UDP-N-acetylglucosamine pyrophosphorylase/glucosamine-1-phosphate N-acetyltransferase